MRILTLAVVLTLGLLAAPRAGNAEPIACPSLATAAQVGVCPTDAQLRHAYLGYCGDDRRMYEKDAITCTNIEHFKKLKNNALWETKDEKFQGYVDCALKPKQIGSAKAFRIQIQPAGKISRVICDYDNDIAFVHRSRTACKLIGNGDCGPDPASCKAECE